MATFTVFQKSINTTYLGKFEPVIDVDIKSKDADPTTLAKIAEDAKAEIEKDTKGFGALETSVKKMDAEIKSKYSKNNMILAPDVVKAAIKAEQAAADKLVSDYIVSASKAAQSAAEKVIEANKKACKTVKKNKFITGAKVTFKGLSIVKSLAVLAGTAGAAAKEYLNIVQKIRNIYREIKKYSETADKRKEKVVEALQKLQEATPKKDNQVAPISDVLPKNVVNAVKEYKDTLAKMQIQATSMSTELDNALKKNPDDTKKINDLIKNITNLNTEVSAGQAFADEAKKTAEDAKKTWKSLKSAVDKGKKLAKLTAKITEMRKAVLDL